MNLGTVAAPPGARPPQVVLATKLLAFNLGFNVLLGVLIAFRFSLIVVAIHAMFIALIWLGVRWARSLLLFVVGCHAVIVIWGLLAAITSNSVVGFVAGTFSRLSIGLVIEVYVAYLLSQRESRAWFYR